MGSTVGAGLELHSVLGNSQRLDGGAMFGNAPRAMWSAWVRPDEHNRIPLVCRSLLCRVPEDGHTVLFETGIGAFFPPDLRERYGVVEDTHVLLQSLAALGVSPEAVDDIVLSHLHFDHAGGLLAPYKEGAAPSLVFPTARFWVSEAAMARARAPHPRDRASFIPELPPLLEASGRLRVIEAGQTSLALSPSLEVKLHYSDGHTPGMMLSELPTANGPLVFGADLIPGAPWVRRAITMGYDRYPERLIDEKTALLDALCDRGGRLFFTHDAEVAVAGLERDDRGRVVVADCAPSLSPDA